MTPLILAAGRDSLPLARLLLSHKAHVDLADGEGRTPLMWAALTGDRELVRLLLEAGADPAIRDQEGETAGELARELHPRVAALIDSWEKKKEGKGQ
jgi:ankyrin repeat protein